MSVSWRTLRADVAQRLRAAGVEAADAEARWLVEEVSGYEGPELLLEESAPATVRGQHQLEHLLERRLSGEPVQYVLGHWNFRGIDLLVDRRVLIPRPETEIVAEVAIEEAVRVGATRGRNNSWGGGATKYTVADLGTGSGAIALAMANELPDAEVWAVDASEDAVAVARANVAGAGNVGVRVRVAQGSWFDALPPELRGGLTVVVTNPPYVSADEYFALDESVRAFEPFEALVSGPTGLEAIDEIIRHAPEWLTPDGAIVVELGAQQGAAAAAAARAVGFTEVDVRRDLAGLDRVLVARR